MSGISGGKPRNVQADAGSGSFAVYFSPSNPSVNATFSATSLEVVPTTGSRVLYDETHQASRVIITGSHSSASLEIKGSLTSISETVKVHDIPGSVAVYFSPSNPSVNATFTATSLETVPTTGSRVLYDESHQAERVLIAGSQSSASLEIKGTLTGITETVRVGDIPGSIAVYFSPSNPSVKATFSGSISAVPESGSGEPLYDEIKNAVIVTPHAQGTMAVYFSPSNPSVNATFSSSSLEVVPTTGSRIMYDDSHQAERVLIAGSQSSASLEIKGTLTSITETVRIYDIPGTVAVYFSPSNPSVNAVFSGSISAVPETGQGDSLFDETYDILKIGAYNTGVSGASTPRVVHATDVGVSVKITDPLPAGSNTLGSIAVFFEPSNPSVNATFSGSIEAVPVTGMGTKLYDDTYDAEKVLIAGSGSSASLEIKGTLTGISNSIAVYFDRGEPSVRVYGSDGIASRSLKMNSDGAVKIYDIADGSISIHSPLPAGTNNIGKVDVASALPSGTNDIGNIIRVKNLVDGTVTLGSALPAGSNNIGSVDIANRPDIQRVYNVVDGTISLGSAIPAGTNEIGKIYDLSGTATTYYQASGTYEGVSDLGKTLASPASGSNIKVYAISITTTAQTGTVVRFTNGAGTATEFWRYALQAPSQGIAGANLAVTPPAYLFATGDNVTLAIHTDNASKIHYSVSYFRESA